MMPYAPLQRFIEVAVFDAKPRQHRRGRRQQSRGCSLVPLHSGWNVARGRWAVPLETGASRPPSVTSRCSSSGSWSPRFRPSAVPPTLPRGRYQQPARHSGRDEALRERPS